MESSSLVTLLNFSHSRRNTLLKDTYKEKHKTHKNELEAHHTQLVTTKKTMIMMVLVLMLFDVVVDDDDDAMTTKTPKIQRQQHNQRVKSVRLAISGCESSNELFILNNYE